MTASLGMMPDRIISRCETCIASSVSTAAAAAISGEIAPCGSPGSGYWQTTISDASTANFSVLPGRRTIHALYDVPSPSPVVAESSP